MLLGKNTRSSVFTTSRPTLADLERETRSCCVNQGPLLIRNYPEGTAIKDKLGWGYDRWTKSKKDTTWQYTSGAFLCSENHWLGQWFQKA